MEYRRLGSAGVKVSALGMGGNEFGWFIDEKATERVVHYALDKGIILAEAWCPAPDGDPRTNDNNWNTNGGFCCNDFSGSFF